MAITEERLDAEAEVALRNSTPKTLPGGRETTPLAFDLTRFALWMRSDPVRFEKFIFLRPETLALAALEYTGE